MSTTLATIQSWPKGREITVTGFWGGQERGPCVQVTEHRIVVSTWHGHNEFHSHPEVQLTISEAKAVAQSINAWLVERGVSL